MDFSIRYKYGRSQLAALLLFALFLASAIFFPATPAAGAPASGGPKSASPGLSADAGQINRLISRIEDPAQRAALIQELRLLLQMQGKNEKKEKKAPAASGTFAGRLLRRLDTSLSRSLKSFEEIPRKIQKELALWKRTFSQKYAYWTAFRFLAAGALAFILFFLFHRFLNRYLLPPKEAGDDGWKTRVRKSIRHWLESILPAGITLLAGSFLVTLLGFSPVGKEIFLLILWAFFLQGFLLGGSAALLTPERPSWRLLPISDSDAAYFSLWARRFILVWVWGAALSEIAAAAWLDNALAGGIAHLYRLVLFLQVLVLISQQRERVRTLLSIGESDKTAASLKLVIGAWNILAARWHFLAILYCAAFFFLWSTGSELEIRYFLTSSLLTILVVCAAFVLHQLVLMGIRWLFAISDRLSYLIPGIEQRANRYTPIVSWTFGLLIWGMALIFAMGAWGLPAIQILFSGPVLVAIQSLAQFVITLAIAVSLIEAAQAVIEYFLEGRKDERGQPIAPTPQQKTLLPLGFTVVKWTVIAVTAMVILGQFGVNIGPVLAGAGILGLAVGFGAQSLVKDIITGVFMLIEDNIAVGDVVRVKDTAGLVESFNLRSVQLRDYDGNVHVIPNSAIDVVTNFTKEYSRSVFDIGVAYRENVDEVINVIREVAEKMREDADWKDIILEPVEIAGVEKFDSSAVIIRGRFKTQPIQQWSVRREFHRRIKNAFDARGIEIPFPYRTLTWAEPKPGNTPAASPGPGGSSVQPDTPGPTESVGR
ncbi:MAG: mechanosensitive ion channel [bacterium]|nr:mechanosensitive ion channel [bacterium]